MATSSPFRNTAAVAYNFYVNNIGSAPSAGFSDDDDGWSVDEDWNTDDEPSTCNKLVPAQLLNAELCDRLMDHLYGTEDCPIVID